MGPRLALRMLAGLAALAASASWAGVQFTHRDWELACDNTRTCRAAGYQAGEASPAVSVLLVREAGPARPVTAQVALGTSEEGKSAPPAQVELTIAGQSLGAVALQAGEAVGTLQPAQVAALLQALLRNEEIAFVAGPQRWRLSDDGAAAVLLRMDDIQGRLGTRGALVRKGSRGEQGVLHPLPKPVVQAAAVGQPASTSLAIAVLRTLRKAPGDCPDLKEPGEAPKAWRLQGHKVLVSARCWVAAYNVGYGFWVAADKPPYTPVTITTSGTVFEPERSRILAMQKGRGLGDCYAIEEWVWDGARFVHTEESTTGMCRLVAAGGPWMLTTLVSEVLPPAGPRTTEEKRK
ncbi:MAG TPA: DUF1176 domain-containing protein [Ramlibacter sp.]|uniref:DUF1176 domain-containing protein n=1 Tax=Ramlibacter sp. TaxID=1917967 RepID=UPI002D800B98|nr:DUF1176 domain-containing protein [Ramlibacter sp.]HET8745106.1 DUF1176 domain-containing protein [Ramlibacter sp.]